MEVHTAYLSWKQHHYLGINKGQQAHKFDLEQVFQGGRAKIREAVVDLGQNGLQGKRCSFVVKQEVKR